MIILNRRETEAIVAVHFSRVCSLFLLLLLCFLVIKTRFRRFLSSPRIPASRNRERNELGTQNSEFVQKNEQCCLLTPLHSRRYNLSCGHRDLHILNEPHSSWAAACCEQSASAATRRGTVEHQCESQQRNSGDSFTVVPAFLVRCLFTRSFWRSAQYNKE